MHNEFTAVIEKDGEWYISYCPEIPGANGQGRTKDECLESLREAVRLILEDRREQGGSPWLFKVVTPSESRLIRTSRGGSP
jgi:predicted RNase H-like HicB family nuclease